MVQADRDHSDVRQTTNRTRAVERWSRRSAVRVVFTAALCVLALGIGAEALALGLPEWSGTVLPVVLIVVAFPAGEILGALMARRGH